jgi:DNA (cytosine-5)-methyltransferase 1
MVTIPNHHARKVNALVQRRIDALGIGQKMQDLPEDLWHDSFRYYVKEDPNRKGGPNLRIIRLDPDQPSLTVTGYIFNKFVHPFENRYITPREAARLQGFPDDLEFKGSLGSVHQQIGDAVPVALGRALFSALLEAAHRAEPTLRVFKSISLFSGAGGLDIAAEQSRSQQHRWQTALSVEIEADRCSTLQGYFGKDHRVLQADIQQLTGHDLLNSAGVSQPDIWLIYGGPPCQAFSQAGKQQGSIDPRGTLIFEFLRLIDEIKPPFFLMENVPNLKSIENGALLRQIRHQAHDLGYHLDYRILNAVHYGSPQKRHRAIFLGTRRDITPSAALPAPTHGEQQQQSDMFGLKPFMTVREAFMGLPTLNLEANAVGGSS